MAKIIGLDVGIASLGWGIIDTEQEKIIDAGVRIFSKAEVPKTGGSLAEDRRIARSMRRRIRRRRHRLDRLKDLFITHQLLTKDTLNTAFLSNKEKLNPWELRYQALNNKLSSENFARALFHIAGRRGFKSNRKSELSESGETGKLLKGVSENSQILKEKEYRTVGEMFFLDPKFSDKKRNHPSSYSHTVSRADLEKEISTIFNKQRDSGNKLASAQFETEFLEIFCSQRSFDDADQINQMRGKCTFEPNEPRAAKFGYSAERFITVSKINNLTFNHAGNTNHLNQEQKQTLLTLCYKQAKVTYKQLRKAIDITPEATFIGLNYSQQSKTGKDAEEQTFAELKGFHTLRKAIEKNCGKTDWANLSNKTKDLDNLAEILTCWKTDYNRERELNIKGFSQNIIDAVLPIGTFSQFIRLSNNAVNKLLPLMEQGQRYDEVWPSIYTHIDADTKTKLLPLIPIDDIRNPIVFRSLTQARKVLNAIIRKHGSPDRIHIELARDMSRSYSERKKIEKAQGEFKLEKERAVSHFIDCFGTEPKGHDLLKFRLHIRQNSQCPYSGKPIETERLLEPGYVDIDHIIPWSRCFDDSLNNKVLVHTAENRQKGNKTPFEYLANSNAESQEWCSFKARVNNFPKAQQWRLLKENVDEKTTNEFREKNKNDTRYIARYLKNFIAEHLVFNSDDKVPVQASNGTLTNYLRVRWGLLKNRNQSDRHHAVDALLVAAITNGMTKRLSDASRRHKLWLSDDVRATAEELIDKQTGEVIASNYQQNTRLQMPQPWNDFAQQVREYTDNEIFVSRMPKRKLKGSAHQETIRSAKYIQTNNDTEQESYVVSKTNLSSLTLSNLETLHDKERNIVLYNTLKQRLEAFNGKAEKAFAEPIYMPLNPKKKSAGQQPTKIKSVKLMRKMGDGVLLHKQGIAAHASMVRTDVFEKENKYYLVPIYVADLIKEQLPNKAITAGQSKNKWPEMDNSYRFCFSLHPNDFIEIKHKKKGIIQGYYLGCHSATATINLVIHDRSLPEQLGLGVKTGLEYFHKYEVDLLGNKYRVRETGIRDGMA